MSKQLIRFNTRLSFDESVLMMSLECSGIDRKLFLLGLLHARLIQHSGLPWDEIFKMCRKENIQSFTESGQELAIDLFVDSCSVKLLTELDGVKEVR